MEVDKKQASDGDGDGGSWYVARWTGGSGGGASRRGAGWLARVAVVGEQRAVARRWEPWEFYVARPPDLCEALPVAWKANQKMGDAAVTVLDAY